MNQRLQCAGSRAGRCGPRVPEIGLRSLNANSQTPLNSAHNSALKVGIIADAMTRTEIDTLAELIAQRVAALLGSEARNPRPRLLTSVQAAAYLGRTERAIRAVEARGVLPAVKGDGRVMFDIRDLDAWIEQNKQRREF